MALFKISFSLHLFFHASLTPPPPMFFFGGGGVVGALIHKTIPLWPEQTLQVAFQFLAYL